MKIFFSGDSHTSGSELSDPNTECYAPILANLLNGEIIENASIGGASIDRILRVTEKFLFLCNGSYPDLIVIGWTEPKRHDWFFEHAPDNYETVNSDNFLADKAYTLNRKRFAIEKRMFENTLAENILCKYFQSRIYNLHLKLNHLKIPHLFFNAHTSYYDHIYNRQSELLIHNEFIEFDWNKRFWNPYHDTHGCFKLWAQYNNYNITNYGHAEAKAHESFAKLLHQYITDNNLLSI